MKESAPKAVETPKETPKEKTDFLRYKDLSLKNILSQVDSGIYKQLFIFLGIALVVATALYIFLRVGQELNVTNENKPRQEPTATTEIDQELKEKIAIDQERKNDVAQINSALKSYFLENDRAPEALEELTPDILDEIPTDPETEKEYTYTPSENFDNWTVSSTLSDGDSFEAKGP